MIASMTSAGIPTLSGEYQEHVYHAVLREYAARWPDQSIWSASGAIDVAVVISPDGRVSSLRTVRNAASEAELSLAIDAIKHAQMPSPPRALLQHGVFHMTLHLGRPKRSNRTLTLTAL